MDSPIITSAAVLEHHRRHGTAAVQDHVRAMILEHRNWVTRWLDLADLLPRHTLASLVERYAAMGPDYPAIIAVPRDGGWEVLDGAHRVAAAAERGEDVIRALVPEED